MLRRISVYVLSAALVVVLVAACAAPFGGRREAVGDVAGEWGLRGEGSELTEPFEMPAGSTAFTVVHEGAGAFSAPLLDAAGNQTALLADGEGATSATETVELRTGGQYRVRVEAAAPWELIVTYPEPGMGGLLQ